MDKKTNAIRIVEASGIHYGLQPYQYDPDDVSVSKIAADNNLDINQIFKTLVLRTDAKDIVLALIPGDSSLDLKKLAKWHGCKWVELVEVNSLPMLTGYIRGACSPIGMKKPFPVYLDEQAQLHDNIFINAGQRGLLMSISPESLQQLCELRIADITA
jgi:Cys-tRNA(Pro)/Cys-tRNA(Cys) deacylase